MPYPPRQREPLYGGIFSQSLLLSLARPTQNHHSTQRCCWRTPAMFCCCRTPATLTLAGEPLGQTRTPTHATCSLLLAGAPSAPPPPHFPPQHRFPTCVMSRSFLLALFLSFASLQCPPSIRTSTGLIF